MSKTRSCFVCLCVVKINDYLRVYVWEGVSGVAGGLLGWAREGEREERVGESEREREREGKVEIIMTETAAIH